MLLVLCLMYSPSTFSSMQPYLSIDLDWRLAEQPSHFSFPKVVDMKSLLVWKEGLFVMAGVLLLRLLICLRLRALIEAYLSNLEEKKQLGARSERVLMCLNVCPSIGKITGERVQQFYPGMKINFEQLSRTLSHTPPHVYNHIDSQEVSVILPKAPRQIHPSTKPLHSSTLPPQENIVDFLSHIPRPRRFNTSFESTLPSVTNTVEDFFLRSRSKETSVDLKSHRINQGLLNSIEKRRSLKQPSPNVYQKLHSQPINKLCKKVSCDSQSYHQNKQMKEEEIDKKKEEFKKKRYRPNLVQDLYSQHRKSRIHNQVRNRFVKFEMMKECTFRPQLKPVPKYLTTYRPLMDRLEEEIAKRKDKEDFMGYHRNLDFSSNNQELFRPQLPNLKKRVSVKSRVYDFMNKSVELQPSKSVERIGEVVSEDLNRSQEIMASMEVDYIDKLTCRLFGNNSILKITADTISIIEEEEFEILYPFVLSIEKGCLLLNKEQFKKKFLRFYKTLTVDKRHSLRFAHRDPSSHYIRILNPQLTMTPSINKDSKKKGDSYLNKLEQFV